MLEDSLANPKTATKQTFQLNQKTKVIGLTRYYANENYNLACYSVKLQVTSLIR